MRKHLVARSLAMVGLLLLGWGVACSDDSPSGPGQSSGIRITALTTGPNMDADGYTVSVDDGAAVPLAPNGVVSMPEIGPGTHTLMLGGVADNCAVLGPNPQVVTIALGASAEVAFAVGCRAVGGSGLVVSDPVPAPAGAQLPASTEPARADLATDTVVYVSLEAGAVPDGSFATVRSLATGLTLATEMRDGGFDPVAVPAQPGDSVEVRVTDVHGETILQTRTAVMMTRAPVIVRAQPPPRKRDVPLNSVIYVVFSEPIDAATLTGSSMWLLRGTTAVAGTVRLLDGSGVTAAFEPAELLSPNTDYRLVVTSAVRDRDGEALASPAAIAFTTGAALLGPVASVTLSYALVEGFFPATTVIRAYVRDASGNDLVGQPVTWTSGDSAVVTVSQSLGNEAWLALGAGGVASITATSGGRADTALVISRPLPPEIETGALRVSVTTTGLDPDVDGYSAIVDGGLGLPLASNGSVTFAGLSVGTHAVALDGVAANCAIADSLGSLANPRNVTVLGGDTVEAAFDVVCAALTGTLRVIVTTTGDSLDADGYGVCVGVGDHGQCQAIGVNDTVAFAGLPVGQGAISLNDVATNCAVVRPGIDTVTIYSDTTNDHIFAVTCTAVTGGGAVEVTTATNGIDQDSDGYGLSIDGKALGYSLNREGRTIVSPLEAGNHFLFLFLVSSNCQVVGDNPRSVAVSAGDTARVAFEVTCSAAERIAFDGMWCTPSPPCEPYPVVHVMFADGSNMWNIVSYGVEPAWSPTGDRIAFTSTGGDINVVTLDGGTVTRLTTHSAEDRSPAWSPDGSRIAFASTRDGRPELYLMSADGSGVVRITDGVGFVGQPAWSPDGGRLAFDCEVETGNRDVCAVNVDGTGLVRLTNDLAADFDPAWSPDGGRIAFATGRYNPFPEIAVMAADGGDVTRVRAGTAGAQPSWSPDGSRIAFALNTGSLYVTVMNADGSGFAQLMTGANPAWKPAPR